MTRTGRQLAMVAACVFAAGPSAVATLRAAPPATRLQSSSTPQAFSPQPVFTQYCVGCHNEKRQTAGLALDTLDLTDVAARAEVWEKVVRKLRLGLMPPAGMPRPDQATYEAITRWIETEIDRAAVARPNPGRTAAIHRLNRTEYGNAIRDLLALDIDVASLFPTEPSTFGLDNIADVLSVSPALMARYTSAARKISRLAIALPPTGPVVETFKAPEKVSQDVRSSDDLPLGSRGGVAFQHYFPADGEYEVKVTLRRGGGEGAIQGLEEPNDLDVRLDGARVKRFTIGGEAPGQPAPLGFSGNISGDPAWQEYQATADRALSVRIAVTAGHHQISASFVARLFEPDGMFRLRRPSHTGNVIESLLREPEVASVAIAGPYGAARIGDVPSRRAIFVCRPKRVAEEEACASRILRTLARRAYRRPATDADVQSLLEFFRIGRREGSFDHGIEFALERLLVAPSFLFRIERDPPRVTPNVPYEISDIELASRLSFFVWSSIPDTTLLDLAEKGRLREPTVLEREARRLLADPRSSALVDNFFSQWLELRNVSTLAPDSTEFPDFDEHLRTAFQREAELFLSTQLAEDRSVAELLTANYTFINERLARHYGIPNVHGSEFRRVVLTDDARIGLLGKGAVLAATSYPNRTSPVLRGRWLLANLLGTPPPDPPADVPGLKDNGPNGRPASVRERLEQHRVNPVCANCHAQFDPLGLALENFDGIGAWRTNDGGTPIDASGAMPGHAAFTGPAGVRQFLVRHRELVVEAVTEKLLAYALGRVTEHYDRPIVRGIVRAARATDYRWSSILTGIVNSTAFRMRMPAPAEDK